MKLLFFTDTHIRAQNPRGRIDDYLKSLKNKLKEIKDIIEREEVDYCLHGGDFFDRPDVVPGAVRECGAILQSFGVPIYMVAGNHDMYGYNPETINRTMLGILDGLGIVQLLDEEDIMILEKEDVKVQLTGQPYYIEIDGPDKKGYLVKKQDEVDYAIHLVHGMLIEGNFFVSHTNFSDIEETEADFLLVGHYHPGFKKIYKAGECQCINPGSMGRVANTKENRTRQVQVVLLDLDKDKAEVSFIPLRSAGDPELVFNDEIQEEKTEKTSLSEYIKDMRGQDILQHDGFEKRIDLLMEKHNYQPKVKIAVKERLEAAEAELLDEG